MATTASVTELFPGTAGFSLLLFFMSFHHDDDTWAG
jgi:hypothetical protein